MSRRDDLAERTQAFAIDAVRFATRRNVPFALDPVIRQFVRASTGIGANYRAARRARSYREFAARLAVAVEEADETVYWLDVLGGGVDHPLEDLDDLRVEGKALRAILSSAWSTTSRRLRSSGGKTT